MFSNQRKETAQRKRDTGVQRKGIVQTKIKVGDPNDKYEQEADAMADKVMSMPEPNVSPLEGGKGGDSIQPKCAACEQEEAQTNPLASLITPLVQRQSLEEEEPVQSKQIQRMSEDEELDTKPIQRMAPEEEEVQTKSIQRMPPEEEEPIQSKRIQRMSPEEEEPIQTKRVQRMSEEEDLPAEVQTKAWLDTKPIQRMGEDEELDTKPIQRMAPEEDELQSKPIQRKAGGSKEVGSSLESQLSTSKGGGNPLPAETNEFMSSRFGTDFSGVKVHTDSNAVQMNKELNSQAFAHGNHIYFNQGKYDTNSSSGKHLLAHELTHTVQQSGKSNSVHTKLAQNPYPVLGRYELTTNLWHNKEWPVKRKRKIKGTNRSENGSYLLRKGSIIDIVASKTKYWYKTVGGGYMYKKYLKKIGKEKLPKSFKYIYDSELKQIIGVEYRWGYHIYIFNLQGDTVHWTMNEPGIGPALFDPSDLIGLGLGRKIIQLLAKKGTKASSLILVKSLPTKIRSLLMKSLKSAKGRKILITQSMKSLANWASRRLLLDRRTIKDLGFEGIKKLKKLPEWAIQKLSKIPNKLKRRILGCASPCKVELRKIRELLAKSFTRFSKKLKIGLSRLKSLKVSDIVGKTNFAPSQNWVSPELVLEYANKMIRNKWNWSKPIVVQRASEGAKKWVITEGTHRFIAAKVAGIRIPKSAFKIEAGKRVPFFWERMLWHNKIK